MHVYDDTVVASVVPAGRYGTVGQQVSGRETARRLTAAGIYIPEPPNGATGDGRCADDTADPGRDGGAPPVRETGLDADEAAEQRPR